MNLLVLKSSVSDPTEAGISALVFRHGGILLLYSALGRSFFASVTHSISRSRVNPVTQCGIALWKPTRDDFIDFSRTPLTVVATENSVGGFSLVCSHGGRCSYDVVAAGGGNHVMRIASSPVAWTSTGVSRAPSF
jgi:hypothetical protein